MPECVFCQRTDLPLTKEHVLPKHWQYEFPEETVHRDYVRRGGVLGRSELLGSKNRYENQIREVCQPCNGGWMRELDEAAKDLVFSVAKNDATVVLGENSNLLSSWATKIALMRCLMDKKDFLQPHRDRYHEFYRSREAFFPRAVQLGRCESSALDDNSAWTPDSAEYSAANVLTTTIGKLFVQIGICDVSDPHWLMETKRMLTAARAYAPGQIVPVRLDRDTFLGPPLTRKQVYRVRENHAVRGILPHQGSPLMGSLEGK